jgi:hypothetical protein
VTVQPASLEILEKAAVPPAQFALLLGLAYFFVSHLQR